MSVYEIFYPGAFNRDDQIVIDEYMRKLETISNGGPVDVRGMIDGKVSSKNDPRIRGDFLGDVTKITPHQAETERLNFDPANPLYSDDDYAKKMGYAGKLYIPPVYDLSVNWREIPPPLRDNLIISGLNHHIEFYSPIYPGDTMYPITEYAGAKELTPEGGSEYRTFAISGGGSIFNQRGELVQKRYSVTKESLRRHVDPKKRNRIPMPKWECPEWWELRPRHVYTKEDWDVIRDVWSREKRRGDSTLYWDDVNVGDQPLVFLEGPVSQLDQIKYHGHMEAGSPALKDVMNDPVLSQTLLVGAYGEYFEPNGVGHLEDGRVPGHRPCFYNFMPANFVVRALFNWAGDMAKLKSIDWRIMCSMPGYEGAIPEYDDGRQYLRRVPFMQGKSVTSHGMAGDVIWVKSYVAGKQQKGGENLVELIWWLETIDGVIYQEGSAVLALQGRT
jgi:acyl dehydratase